MTTINAESTFGNFAFKVEGEASDKATAALANLGLLQLLQRTPASNAEKSLAGYDKRPEKFQRSTIAFSEANAEVLAKHLGEVSVSVGEGESETITLLVSVSEHVINGGKEPIHAQAKAIYARKNGNMESIKAMAEKVGYTGDVGDGKTMPEEFAKATTAWMRTALD